MFDDRDPDELRRVHKLGTEILKICADAGGTISGEHGVGTEKLKETHLIFSETDLGFMRLVKKAFDPRDIMNPGKVIPYADAPGYSVIFPELWARNTSRGILMSLTGMR
jgi:glycolate oxidase